MLNRISLNFKLNGEDLIGGEWSWSHTMTCTHIHALWKANFKHINSNKIIALGFKQIKQEKYVFFYGGKDNEWIQQFNKKAATLANDPVMRDTKISIELFRVGKGSKGEDEPNILGHF